MRINSVRSRLFQEAKRVVGFLTGGWISSHVWVGVSPSRCSYTGCEAEKMNWLQVCYQLSEEAWCGRGVVLNGTKVVEFSNDSKMTLHISRRSSHRTLALNRSRSFSPVCSTVTLVFCGMWRIQSLKLGVLGATGCVLHLYALLDNVRHPAAHLICLCSPAQTLCTGLPVPLRARHTQIRKN